MQRWIITLKKEYILIKYWQIYLYSATYICIYIYANTQIPFDKICIAKKILTSSDFMSSLYDVYKSIHNVMYNT